jgi:hypothetical protein
MTQVSVNAVLLEALRNAKTEIARLSRAVKRGNLRALEAERIRDKAIARAEDLDLAALKGNAEIARLRRLVQDGARND